MITDNLVIGYCLQTYIDTNVITHRALDVVITSL